MDPRADFLPSVSQSSVLNYCHGMLHFHFQGLVRAPCKRGGAPVARAAGREASETAGGGEARGRRESQKSRRE